MSASSSQVKSELKRGRIDLTLETDPSNTRLDGLAELLAVGSNSTCIAIAVIDGKFVIASNEFFKGSEPPKTGTRLNNSQITSIRKIFDYFQDIAHKKTLPPLTERKGIFTEICGQMKAGLKEPELFKILEKSNTEKLINDVFSKRKTENISFSSEYRTKAATAAAAYQHWKRLYKAFSKLEQSLILNEKDKDYEKLSVQHRGAFFQNPTILITETEKGVHAEVQILSTVAGLVEANKEPAEKEVYIGVSKLCCLECRVMVSESKTLLEKRGILLGTRGHHDLEFDGWTVPDRFREGYEALEAPSTEPSLSFKIGQNTRLVTVELKKHKHPEKYPSQIHSPSSGGTPTKLSQDLTVDNAANNIVDLVERMVNTNKDISSEQIQIAVILLQMPEFSNVRTGERAGREVFGAIVQFLRSKSPLSEEAIVNLLKDPTFVGEAAAHFFSESERQMREESGNISSPGQVTSPARGYDGEPSRVAGSNAQSDTEMRLDVNPILVAQWSAATADPAEQPQQMGGNAPAPLIHSPGAPGSHSDEESPPSVEPEAKRQRFNDGEKRKR